MAFDNTDYTLISFPVAVRNFNFIDRSLLKFGGAQYCSCKTRDKCHLKSGTRGI